VVGFGWKEKAGRCLHHVRNWLSKLPACELLDVLPRQPSAHGLAVKIAERLLLGPHSGPWPISARWVVGHRKNTFSSSP